MQYRANMSKIEVYTLKKKQPKAKTLDQFSMILNYRTIQHIYKENPVRLYADFIKRLAYSFINYNSLHELLYTIPEQNSRLVLNLF